MHLVCSIYTIVIDERKIDHNDHTKYNTTKRNPSYNQHDLPQLLLKD